MGKKTNLQETGVVVELLAGYTDEEGVTHKEIEIREMTGNDEENIAKPEVRGNIGKIVTTLLANCVLRIGTLERDSMKPEKWEKIMQNLFLGDRDFILFKLREITYGKEMNFETRCTDPNCRKTMTLNFGIEEVEIKPLVGDPYKIPFTLPKGYLEDATLHKDGTMRMPTGFDQEHLDSIARKNPGLANTTLITRCVTSLGTLKLSSKIFRDLSQRDREYLILTLADNVFGPRFLVSATCENCGNDFEAGVNPVNFI